MLLHAGMARIISLAGSSHQTSPRTPSSENANPPIEEMLWHAHAGVIQGTAIKAMMWGQVADKHHPLLREGREVWIG